MIPSEYMKFLNEIEGKFPVNQWTYGSVHIWPLIRVILGFQLHDLDDSESVKSKNVSGSFQKIKNKLLGGKDHWQFLKAILLDKEHNDSAKRKSAVVILGDAWDRRVEIDGKWFNVFSDPFLLEFEKHGITPLILEAAPKPLYPIPRFSKSVYIQLELDKIKIHSYFSDNLDLQLKAYDEVNQYLNDRNLNVQLLHPKQMWKYFKRLFLMKNLFKSILENAGAKLGITVDYYNVRGMAWCLACHELGIPSMDIQHGVAGEQSCAYGSWKSLPEHGYEIIPSIFWSWSKEDGEAIQAWNSAVEPNHRTIVGGNLWIKLWKNNFMGIHDVDSSRIQQIKQKSPLKSHILYTMQNTTIHPLVLEAISKTNDYFWWIRVHPTLMNQIDIIKNSVKHYCNVEVENASKLPLFSIFSAVDVHVTGWSAAVYDAKSFNVPSIVLNNTIAKDWFNAEIHNGWVKISISTSSLLENLKTQIDFKHNICNQETQHSTYDGMNKLLEIVNKN
jgi:hypothetical protein